MIDTNYLEITSRNGVTVITLNRAPVNAFNWALIQQLSLALRKCAEDSTVHALVIASKSPRVFSAGADLKGLANMNSSDQKEFGKFGQSTFKYIQTLPKPVIAAVAGAALGGGCELAMACDLRIAGESASFGQPEVILGLAPGWGGTQRLPRLVGKTAALAMILTGESISVQQAFALGLVNRVVPNDKTLGEAILLAEQIAQRSPKTIAIIKEAFHKGLSEPLEKGLDIETNAFLETLETDDAQEGIQAFLEKRAPLFKGS